MRGLQKLNRMFACIQCLMQFKHVLKMQASPSLREYVGHGIGADLHEEPQIPNYGIPDEDLD